jgi:hypothetical protein
MASIRSDRRHSADLSARRRAEIEAGLRIDAGLAPRPIPPIRSAFWPPGPSCTTAAAPSLMPEALPAVTVPSFSKAGRACPLPRSWRRDGEIHRCHHDIAGRGDRGISSRAAGLLYGLRLVLRADRELILLGARDLTAWRRSRRYAHVITVEASHRPSLIMVSTNSTGPILTPPRR